MSIEALKQQLPDFAKDVRLNLSGIANDETLSPETKWGLLLACAIATRNRQVAEAIEGEATAHLSPKARDAACAAAALMAMNNVYYRFTHLVSNKSYQSMPAKLRMTVLANPGVSKADFELWCLAVSAINGCGMCVDSHEKILAEAGVNQEAIQTAVRFAGIIQSTAVALEAAGLPVAA
jgi:lipoyl-dependent peroxiredoxin subunit D